MVIWKWQWIEQEEFDSGSEISQTSSDLSHKNSDKDTSDSDAGSECFPETTHSVVFKCIGVLKEQRYQETLALAANIIQAGQEIPVQLQKEPNNPVDTRAIVFECKVDDKWERIGYVVREALDEVHDAIDRNLIWKVNCDWVIHCPISKRQGSRSLTAGSGQNMLCSVILNGSIIFVLGGVSSRNWHGFLC